MGRTGCVPKDVSEIEIFANHDDSSLLLEAYGGANPQKLSVDLMAAMPEIRGVSFFATSAGPDTAESKSLGESALIYRAGESSFRVSAGSFFQINRFLTPELPGIVIGDESGGTALDLYAGVGLFARPMAERFGKVMAVESSPASAADLKANLPKNAKAVRSTTEEFLAKSRDLRPDFIVVDPPRAGLGEKTTKMLAAMAAPRITYLSCDPTTLARDVNALLKSGYRVEEVRLIDLFPQTFHIESLVRLRR
jgi:23S rRNA (uracil1939-C5)-methyltransferase